MLWIPQQWWRFLSQVKDKIETKYVKFLSSKVRYSCLEWEGRKDKGSATSAQRKFLQLVSDSATRKRLMPESRNTSALSLKHAMYAGGLLVAPKVHWFGTLVAPKALCAWLVQLWLAFCGRDFGESPAYSIYIKFTIFFAGPPSTETAFPATHHQWHPHRWNSDILIHFQENIFKHKSSTSSSLWPKKNIPKRCLNPQYGFVTIHGWLLLWTIEATNAQLLLIFPILRHGGKPTCNNRSPAPRLKEHPCANTWGVLMSAFGNLVNQLRELVKHIYVKTCEKSMVKVAIYNGIEQNVWKNTSGWQFNTGLVSHASWNTLQNGLDGLQTCVLNDVDRRFRFQEDLYT